MSTIAIVGAGPGGMATALAAHRAGFDVKLYERYPEVMAAGNILNLWPPPPEGAAGARRRYRRPGCAHGHRVPQSAGQGPRQRQARPEGQEGLRGK